MNKVFKVVFNKATGTYMAVSEYAKGQGKNKTRISSQNNAEVFSLKYLAAAILLAISASAVAADGNQVTASSGSPSTVNNTGNNANLCYYDIGSSSVICGDSTTKTTTSNATAIGTSAQALNANTIAIGSNVKANNQKAIVIGNNLNTTTTAGEDSVAIGNDNVKATGQYSTAIGGGGSTGRATEATQQGATAIGYDAHATGVGSFALGRDSNALAEGSMSIGINSQASRVDSISIGRSSRAGENNATAMGENAFSYGTSATAIGQNAWVGDRNKYNSNTNTYTGSNPSNAIAIGNGAQTYFRSSIVFGDEARITGDTTNSENGQNSIAIGRKAKILSSNSIAMGAFATVKKQPFSASANAIGYGATIEENSRYATALGDGTNSKGQHAIAIGGGPYTTSNGQGSGAKASGFGAIAIGGGLNSTKPAASADGDRTIAIGISSSVTKENAVALGSSAKTTKKDGVAIGASSLADRAALSGVTVTVTPATNTNQVYGVGSTTDKNTIAGTVSGNLGAVSVGKSGSTRQIINVASGRDDSDAVNVAQLRAVANSANRRNYLHVNRNSGPASGNTTNLATVDGIGGAKGGYSLAAGVNAQATQKVATAIGYKAQATGTGSVAIGGASGAVPVTASGPNAIAISAGAKATNTNTFAMGYRSEANTHSGIAIGAINYATANKTTRNYPEVTDTQISNLVNTALGYGGLAMGVNSEVIDYAGGRGGVALGTSNLSKGKGAVAIGAVTNATANATIAIGAKVTASQEAAIAIGKSSTASIANGVAIGSNSSATTTAGIQGYDPLARATAPTGNEWESTLAAVSIGDGSTQTRQITGLAAGTQDTDAVNVAQLKTLASSVGSLKKNYFHVNPSTTAATASGTDNLDDVDGVGNSIGARSLAAGSKARAMSSNSTSVGFFSTAKGTAATAFGSGASANGEQSQTFGSDAAANDYDVVIGAGALTATDTNGNAIRNNSSGVPLEFVTRSAGKNVAIGYFAGRNMAANSQENVITGFQAGTNVNGDANIISGNRAGIDTKGNANIIIGDQAGGGAISGLFLPTVVDVSMKGNQNIAVGKYSGTNANGNDNILQGIGSGASVTGNNNVAIGYSAGTAVDVANPATVISSTQTFSNTVNIGYKTQALANSAVAIGNGAKTGVGNAVAIGSNSSATTTAGIQGYDPFNQTSATDKATATWTATKAAVSVGADTTTGGAFEQTRQITGVAAGKVDTDAVNVAQLKALSNQVNSENYFHTNTSFDANKNGKLDASEVGNNGTGNATTNLAKVNEAGGATGQLTVAAGIGAQATSTKSVAIGSKAVASGEDAYALGSGSRARGENSIALGTGSAAGASTGTALSKIETIAIGNNTKAYASQAISIGSDIKTSGDYGIAIGSNTSARKIDSIGYAAVAIGSGGSNFGAMANGESSVAIGGGNKASTGTLNGASTTKNATNAVAIGSGSSSSEKDVVALGSSSVANTAAGVIGYDASGTDHSADTSGIWKSTSGAVSIGDVNGKNKITRQITSVAAGTNDADAVNVAQLKASAWQIAGNDKSKVGNGVNSGDKVSFLNGNATTVTVATDGTKDYTIKYDIKTDGTTVKVDGNKIKAVTDGFTASGGKISATTGTALATSSDIADAINKSGFTLTSSNKGTTTGVTEVINPNDILTINGASDAVKVSQAGGTIGIDVDTSKINIGYKANGANAHTVSLADGLDFQNGTNTKTTVDSDGKVTYSLNDEITLSKVTAGTGSNRVIIGTAGVKVGGDTYITGSGINANSQKITNVANGTINSDAVNLGQLKASQIHYFSVNSSGGANYNNDGATGNNAIAIGREAQATQTNAMATGFRAKATGLHSVAYGTVSIADKRDASALGVGAKAQGLRSTAVGRAANASKNDATAVGFVSKATGLRATAIGRNAQATNTNATATGYGARAIELNASAYGTSSLADKRDASAFGAGAKAQGLRSTAVGRAANASKNDTTAVGFVSKATGLRATALGRNAQATNTNATATGYGARAIEVNASAYGTSSLADKRDASAFGAGAKAQGSRAIAIGRAAEAKANNTTAVGSYSDATMVGSQAIGYGAQATGNYANANGYSADAIGRYSNAVGYNAEAKQDFSNAQGYRANADGRHAIATGTRSAATANNTTAIGSYTDATKTGATAVGYGAQATGNYALASGYGADAKANYSNAIGYDAQANSGQSIAIGRLSRANSKVGSIALGSQSIATVGAGVVGYDPVTGLPSTTPNTTWRSNRSALSIGDGTTITRQITSVAAGKKDTDAVNVAQLKAASQPWKLRKSGSSATNEINPTNTVEFEDGTYTTAIVTNEDTNGVTKVKYDIKATKAKVVFTGDTGTSDVALGNTYNIKGTTNEVVTKDDGNGTLTIKLADSIRNGIAAGKTVVAAGKNVTVSKSAGSGSTPDTYTVNVVTDELITTNGTVNTTSSDAPVSATSVASAINSVGWNIANNGTQKDLVTAGNTVNFANGQATTATVTHNNGTSTVKYDVNVDNSTIKVVGGKLQANTSAIATGTKLTYKSNGVNTQSVSLANGLDFIDGANSNITATVSANGKIQHTLKKDIVVDSVKTGDTLVNNNGMTIVGGPSVTKTGINAANKKITNVANGDINSTSKDTVNGSQIYAISNANKNIYGGNSTVNNDGTVTMTNVGGTGKDNIHDAIASINATAGKHSTVSAGDNMTVTAVTTNGKIDYEVATKKSVEFDNVKVGNVVINKNTGINAGNKQVTNVASGLGGRTLNQIKAQGNSAPEWNNAATVGDLTTIQGNVSNFSNNYQKTLGNAYVNANGKLTIDGKLALKTYNVDGQDEFINNSVISAVKNMNSEGIKFFHTNDETAGSDIARQDSNTIDSSAGGAYSTAIGYQAKVSNVATNGLAIGKGAQANAENTISIGTGNIVNGKNSGAIGDPSVINGANSYSMGNNNTIDANVAQGAFILGNSVDAKVDNSVYLGNDSHAAAGAGVGTAALKSDGTAGSTTSAGDRGTVTQATVGNVTYGGFAGAKASGVVTVGASGTERRIQNVAAGEISATSTDAINGSQLNAVAMQVSSNANGIVGNAVAISGNAVAITGNTNAIKDNKKQIVDNADAIKVNAGNIETLNKGGAGVVRYSNADSPKTPNGGIPSNDVTIVGAKANTPVRVHNVAAGKANTDAVNVGQLRQLGYDLDDRINAVDDKANAGIAGATAIAFLQTPREPGKSAMSLAIGGYRSEKALAIGYSNNSDNNKWQIKMGASVNTQSDVNYGGSVGLQW